MADVKISHAIFGWCIDRMHWKCPGSFKPSESQKVICNCTTCNHEEE